MSKKYSANDAPGMVGDRSRNPVSGQLREKRGDTQAHTIEAEYNVDLGVRGDTRLDTLRERTGETALSDVIAALRKQQ